MCLSLNENAQLCVAKRNITVYKRVNKIVINYISSVNTGDVFLAIIKGKHCSGEIYKDDKIIYLCSNDLTFNGLSSPNKLGYKYSWRLDDLVTSLIVNGKQLIDGVKKIDGFTTPYQNAYVKIGETYNSNLIREGNEVYVGLHSYVNLLDTCFHFIDDNCFIVKCIIPKGSNYYKGIFIYRDSYASDILKYERKLNIFEKLYIELYKLWKN